MYYECDYDLSIASPSGSLRFQRATGRYTYYPRSEAEGRFIENSPSFRSGDIRRIDDPKPVEDAPKKKKARPVEERLTVEQVTTAKQALEWLVANKGVKRAVMSKAEVLNIASRMGVEFPNIKR